MADDFLTTSFLRICAPCLRNFSVAVIFMNTNILLPFRVLCVIQHAVEAEGFAEAVKNGSQAANQMFFAFPVLKLKACFLIIIRYEQI